jgi:hypothetical protein
MSGLSNAPDIPALPPLTYPLLAVKGPRGGFKKLIAITNSGVIIVTKDDGVTFKTYKRVGWALRYLKVSRRKAGQIRLALNSPPIGILDFLQCQSV